MKQNHNHKSRSRRRALFGEHLEDRRLLAVLTVTRFDDPIPNGCLAGDCSLREAIDAANSNSEEDEIILAAGTYELSLAGIGEDGALLGDLDLLGGGQLLTIRGAGTAQTVIDANSLDRAFEVFSGAQAEFEALTITGGLTFSSSFGPPLNLDGGGILNRGDLQLFQVSVTANSTGQGGVVGGGAGGGIANLGTLVMLESSVSGNSTGNGLNGSSGGSGGGILNVGSLEVERSTISGNTAGRGADGDSASVSDGGSGGGLANNGTATLINSTVSGNSAGDGGTLLGGGGPNGPSAGGDGGDGGGISSLRELTLLNTTVVLNRAGAGGTPNGNDGLGGGIFSFPNGSTLLTNSLVAGNFRADASVPDDLAGQVQSSSGFNLIGDAATSGGLVHNANGNLVGNNGTGTLDIATVIDPTLEANGGPTQTHRLEDNSPAIDAGTDLRSLGVTVDQRTVPRPGDGIGFDIGAFEVFSFAIRGRKFEDLNGDGDDEGGTDPGLAGVTIFLDDNGNGAPDGNERQTVTAAGGSYEFVNLPPGTYTVREVASEGSIQTTADPAPISATNGTAANGVDFGNFELVAIRGRKFEDLNGDGDDEGGTDPGVAGVVIYLDRNGNGVLDSNEPQTLSLNDGRYEFSDLGPGTYTVREVVPAGSIQTTPDPAPIVGSSGLEIEGIDFGNFRLGVLRGQKIDDANANGQRDQGEVGLNGWTIELVDRITGQVVASQLTTSIDLNDDQLIDPAREQGVYIFTDVELGDYEIREVPQTGWEPTFPRPRFAISSTLATAIAPTGSRSADLDGDNDLDLVVTSDHAASVEVLFNDGNGNFSSPVRVAQAVRPQSIAVGDLNNDSALDLVVASVGIPGNTSTSSNTVLVLLNTGTGNFEAARPIAAGDGPISVDIADLTGDGFDDVVTANFRSHDISLLINDGTGALELATSLPTSLQPVAVAAGDLDGDGDRDLAAASYATGSITLWLNDGNGSFAVRSTFFAGNHPADVQLADLDGDLSLDLIVAIHGAPEDPNQEAVVVFLNSGNGTFANPARHLAGFRPKSVTVGDVNDDGTSDLVVAVSGPNSSTPAATTGAVAILYGNGTGSFSAPFHFAAGRGPESVNIGDWDRDGDQDLAAANYLGGTLTVLTSQPGTHRVTVATSGVDLADLDFGNARSIAPAVANEGGIFSSLHGEAEFPFHNVTNPRDVSGDGVVSPQDALIVINELNSYGARSLVGGEGERASMSGRNRVPELLVDTNRDNQVSPLDALLVINALNASRGGQSEGEGANIFGVATIPSAIAASRLTTVEFDARRDRLSVVYRIPGAQDQLPYAVASGWGFSCASASDPASASSTLTPRHIVFATLEEGDWEDFLSDLHDDLATP